MSSALAKRIAAIEARLASAAGGDLASRLQRARENRSTWCPPYTDAELRELSGRDDLLGSVARGLLRAGLVAERSRSAPPPEDLLVDVAGALTHDPLRFVLFAFENVELRTWQREELIELGERLRSNAMLGTWPAIFQAWLSGNGAGKSAILSALVWWALATHEGARVIVSAPAEHTLRSKFLPELNRWGNLFVARHWFVSQVMSIAAADERWAKNWRADLITFNPANPAASAGLHNQGRRILLIADEASGLEDSFFEVARGSLTDEATEMVFIAACNPLRAEGEMARAHDVSRALWHTRNIDVREVEGINREQIDAYVREYGIDSDFCRVRVLGIPPRVSLSALFSAADIDAAMERSATPADPFELELYPVVVGIDPARLGKNSTVIATRRGKRADYYELIRLQGANAIAVVDRLVEHVRLLRRSGHVVHVCVDETGLGGPILDIVRERGLQHVHGVNFGSRAAAEARYRNRRAEILDRVRAFIRDGVLPKDETLKQEMLAVDAWYDEQGRLQIEPKRLVNAKLGEGRSTDALDAIALTLAVEVATIEDDGRSERWRERRRAYEDDPFAVALEETYDSSAR